MPLTPVLAVSAIPAALQRPARERTFSVVDAAAAEQQEQLVVRSRCGDAAAFASLIGSVERVALAVALGVVGEATAAGDVVQEAFLRAWQRLAELKEPRKFSPWLCGIVRNLAIDLARARAVRAAAGSGAIDACDAVDGAATPYDELVRQEEHARLAAAVATLDEVSRSALALRYYENLSSRQIGELLGIAPTAVDMRLMRARRQLRQHLEKVHAAPRTSSEGVL